MEEVGGLSVFVCHEVGPGEALKPGEACEAEIEIGEPVSAKAKETEERVL